MNLITAVAPGRVNIIGDHTDYTGGLVLPMAINLATTITGERNDSGLIRLTSADEAGEVVIPIGIDDPTQVAPTWGRYVAGVVKALRETGTGTATVQSGGIAAGFSGHVTTTLPVGAGLSSSAALEVAVALALGFSGSIIELAKLTQHAEHIASGVPCGILDQLSSAGGVAGHALKIDCHSLEIEPVPMPDDIEVVILFGHHRTLVGSAYAERVAQCAAAEALIGPLRLATLDDVLEIDDAVVAMRAQHVVSENQRVRDFGVAMRSSDYRAAGALMIESHQSLRNEFETSTPHMDSLVSELMIARGVYGARMTGGGFGGCVVALTEPGALEDGWHVTASRGALLA
jgi:galactokinase